MAKLPGIVQQPVGEFASGNIPVPNYMARGQAITNVITATAGAIETIRAVNEVADVDTASGEAANELSQLEAELLNRRTIPVEELPDDVAADTEITIQDGLQDGREEVDRPFVYTHEVANEIWERRSREIIDHWAQTIDNERAREKFRGEMLERYVAPGTGRIATSTIQQANAQNRAVAERALQDIAASNAPPEMREEAMNEVIARRALMGEDPVWVTNAREAVGQMIDQIDIQNRVIAATTEDQLDIIDQDMWSGGYRITPEQMRTQSEQIAKKRRQLEAERTERQAENADAMLQAFADPNVAFGVNDVVQALAADEIDHEDGWTFLNALERGGSTNASDPFALSRYRGAINTMAYTGANALVSDRADLLRLSITRASMGLNPDGSVNPQGPTLSGQDAFTLLQDVTNREEAALENNDYDNALRDLYAWTRVKVDLEGRIVAGIAGSQGTVEAAIAMKRGLDHYMDQFGVDADPVSWVQENRDTFDPNHFETGLNSRFRAEFPYAAPFMTVEADQTVTFTQDQQDAFVTYFNENLSTFEPAIADRMWATFKAYYRGQGVAPNEGALMLEGDDPMYRQFEAMMMPDTDNE